MKKTILLLLSVLFLLSSCVTYTPAMGLTQITVPEEGEKKETRFRVISEEKRLAEEKKLAEEKAIEDARLAEEKAIEDALLQEEKRIADEKAAAEKAIEDARLEQERIAKEEKRKIEEARLAEENRIAEEKRIADEKAANEATLRVNLEKYLATNPIPNIDSIIFPHVYKPQNTNTLISDSFTLIDTLLVPLGINELSSEAIANIAYSISDINYPFIFITGSIENQVAFIKALDRDAVILEGGSIAFISSFLKADSKSATFNISQNKTIEISAASLNESALESDNFDLDAYKTYIAERSDDRINEVKEIFADIEEKASIIALSSSEPSDLDWSPFTEYPYRNDYAWPLSIAIREEGYSDSFRDTHYSEETDPGITLETNSISERVDFIYSKGLMNVYTSNIAISGLSDQEKPVYGVIASFLLP